MMKLVCGKLEDLTAKQVYEMLKARNEVFVVEQNCVYQDCDGFDYGLHVFYEDEDGKVLAYLRMYEVDDSDMFDFERMDGQGTIRYKVKEGKKTVQMGRVLTIERGKGYGASILKEGIKAAREIMKADVIYAEAESYVVGFYEKENFSLNPVEFLKDDIPHKIMDLEL